MHYKKTPILKAKLKLLIQEFLCLKEKIKNILRKRYKIERFDKMKNKFNCVKL